MNTVLYENMLKAQKKFFNTGITLPINFRINALKKLKNSIDKHEDEIADALKEDLGKSKSEAYMCEIGLVKSEINYMVKAHKALCKGKTRDDSYHKFLLKKLCQNVAVWVRAHNEPVELSFSADNGASR